MTSILTPQKLRLAYTTSDPTPSNGDVWYRGDLQALLAYLGGVKYISTERTPEVVVAASDAPDFVKRHADYVCDGSADEEEINDAISSIAGKGGVVKLSQGTFYVSITASINMAEGVYLEGSGATATYIDAGSRTTSSPSVITNYGYNGGIGRLRIKNIVDYSPILHAEGSVYLHIYDFWTYEGGNYKPLEIVEDSGGGRPTVFMIRSRIEGKNSEIEAYRLNMVNNLIKLTENFTIDTELHAGSVVVGNIFYGGKVTFEGATITIAGNDFEVNSVDFHCADAAISSNKIGDASATESVTFSGNRMAVGANSIYCGGDITISGILIDFSGNHVYGNVSITRSDVVASSNLFNKAVSVSGSRIVLGANRFAQGLTLTADSEYCCVVGNKGRIMDSGVSNHVEANCPA